MLSFSSLIVISQFFLIINSCANILMYYSVYNILQLKVENIRKSCREFFLMTILCISFKYRENGSNDILNTVVL